MAGGERVEMLGLAVSMVVGVVLGWALCALMTANKVHNHHNAIANLQAAVRLINLEIIRLDHHDG